MVDQHIRARLRELLQRPTESRRVRIVGPIYLYVHDRFPVEQAFIVAFRRVWRKRKRAMKDELLTYWRRKDAGKNTIPQICLVGELPREASSPDEDLLGKCFENGVFLHFAANLIEDMPGYLLEVLTSHELLHAARVANGTMKDDRAVEEEEVREENTTLAVMPFENS